MEVRGTNNSLVHPRGAEGVVTRTPAGEEKHFLVRFPDGFEFSLQRDQMEVLKHFKARLGVPNSDSARADLELGAPFDLESFIIYRCVVGSRAYGLDHDDSDTDRRGIYLAPTDLQWSLFGAPEQFEDNGSQIFVAQDLHPNAFSRKINPRAELHVTTEQGPRREVPEATKFFLQLLSAPEDS